MLTGMRAFLALLASSIVFGLAASGGCSSNEATDTTSTTVAATVAGAGGSLGFGCFGGSPDHSGRSGSTWVRST